MYRLKINVDLRKKVSEECAVYQGSKACEIYVSSQIYNTEKEWNMIITMTNDKINK